MCRSSGAAGPGFPGYPAPPHSQLPVGTTTTTTDSSSPILLSTATEEQGGASSNSAAPPASTTASPSAVNSLGSTNSSNRTGLFQSQSSYTGASQALLDEPQGSFAFSARSLSQLAASVDGEAQEEEAQEQSEEASTPQTSAHSASFTVGVEEEDVNMMEIRQRRLQRFHSSPVSPQPAPLGQDSGTGKTSLTGETDAAGETGESETTSESRD